MVQYLDQVIKNKNNYFNIQWQKNKNNYDGKKAD